VSGRERDVIGTIRAFAECSLQVKESAASGCSTNTV
jgi:hypothetical protein